MSELERVRLAELADVVRGVTYDKASASSAPDPDKIPLLRATNIGSVLNFDDFVYVPRSVVKSVQRLRLGDIVVATSSGSLSVVGKAAPLRHEWDGTFGAFCGVVRPRKEFINPGYLAQYLQTTEYRQTISALAAGVNINNLKREHLENLEIPLAPLAEQGRIVKEMDSYGTRLDEAASLLERAQRNLKRYRASVLKAAVEGRLVPTEAELARAEKRDYEPASVLLKRILVERQQRWESEGRRGKSPKSDGSKGNNRYKMPEGWCWATLGQVAPLQAGYAFPSHGFVETGVRLLKGVNVRDGWISSSEIDHWRSDDALRFGSFRLSTGDVVLAMDRPVYSSGSKDTKVARLDDSWEGALLLQRVGVFRRSLGIDPCYLYWFLRSDSFRDYLVGGQTGTQDGKDLPHVSAGTVDGCPFPVPPLIEQQRIGLEIERRVSLVGQLQGTTTDSKSRCARLRQSILKWAFEGKLVDQDPNDEPASALLARIKGEAPTTAPKKTAAPRRAKKTA